MSPLAATLALTGLFAAAGCSSSTKAESAPADVGPSASAGTRASVSPALKTRTVGWTVGQWYAYSLTLTTAVSFGAGPNVFDFDLQGLLEITPTSATPDVVTLYLAIADPAIVSRVPKSQPQFDKVAAQLRGTGCFFTLSAGRVTEMRVPSGLSPTAATSYREIGSALQVAGAPEGSDQYSAEEYDTTGQYVAAYQLDLEQNLWHKRKQRYIGILASKTASANAPARIVPQIDASDGILRLLPDGRPESIELHDTVTVNGAQQPVHSTTAISLQSRASEPDRRPDRDWTAALGAMKRVGADEPYGGEATIESLDAARIGSVTFEKAVARFEEFGRERSGAVVSSVNGAAVDPSEKATREKTTEEESRLFMALAAILREEPKSVSAAVRKIQAKSPAADILISALGSASSPPAQSALVNLANAKDADPMVRKRALMALSRTPSPDERSVDALTAIATDDPFNEQALLGLGTYSRRLRDVGAGDKANAIGELLVSRLAAGKNTLDRLTALRAITNSGYAPALAPVTPYLTDGQDVIRVAAVRALQSMNDSKVDDIIAERLKSDSSSDVRISALNAAKVRPPGDVIVRAVEDAAKHAPDPRVRYRAVELLTVWLSSRPDARAALEQVAKNDSEARIRDRAQSVL